MVVSIANNTDLRALRVALGLRQLDLVKLLNVQPSTVYLWEKGKGISPMGRDVLVAFLRQPQVLRKLVASMDQDALLAALGNLAPDVLR